MNPLDVNVFVLYLYSICITSEHFYMFKHGLTLWLLMFCQEPGSTSSSLASLRGESLQVLHPGFGVRWVNTWFTGFVKFSVTVKIVLEVAGKTKWLLLSKGSGVSSLSFKIWHYIKLHYSVFTCCSPCGKEMCIECDLSSFRYLLNALSAPPPTYPVFPMFPKMWLQHHLIIPIKK